MTGTFDNAAGVSGLVAASLSFTMLVSPLANLMLVRTYYDQGVSSPTPTVNNVSGLLALADTFAVTTETMWWIPNPPTGLVTVSVVFNSRSGNMIAASYIGASYRSLPNPTGNNAATASTASTIPVVTTLANSTVVSSVTAFVTPTSGLSAGANTVARNTQFANSVASGIFDSNGPVAAIGSYTENASWTGSSDFVAVGLAFGPGEDPVYYRAGNGILMKKVAQ